MNLHTVHFCKLLRYRLCNSIYDTIKPCNHVSNNVKYMSTTTKSIIYPDHKIVYAFPYIMYASILNKTKRNCTIFFGASIPIAGTLQMLNLVSMDDTIQFIICTFLTAFVPHIICYVCNNVIGSVYYKKDNEQVIISYINYWGKRIDLMTDINDIVPFTDNSTNIYNILYRNLFVKSCNKNLKISIKHGKIIDESDFNNIFGLYEEY